VWILGEWEPSWELGDPARQEGKKADSWRQTVEEDRPSRIPQDSGGGLVTTPSHVDAQSERCCALYNCCHIRKNHNRNRVLLYYLFQENKSLGSKTPFAFILWCTGSCVEHNTYIETAAYI
jgi:hypothetical protein